MFFEYFGCLGTSPGGLGHILSPRLEFLWFWWRFRRENLVPFWFLFWYLLDLIFSVFWVHVFLSFCDFGCQKHPKWEAFGGHFEVIFGDQRFLDFWYPYCTKPYILRSGGYPKCIIFGDFFEGALREASGTRFFCDFERFWAPCGNPFGSKKAAKTGFQKSDRKGDCGSVRDEGPGPL